MYRKLFIDSASSIIKENKLPVKEKHSKSLSTQQFKLDNDNKTLFKSDIGDYYTINFEAKIPYKYPKKISQKVNYALKNILKKYNTNGSTLIIGLGNSSVIGDSLGPKTISKLIATYHYDNFITIPKVALFSPEVIGKTGISSFNLIKMLVNDIHPSLIIFIDSLETISPNNLNTSIEITDTGIIPGSSLSTNRQITKNTFNIPIIAIGIPLFLNYENNLYSSLNINEIVETMSNLLATSLNNYFFS